MTDFQDPQHIASEVEGYKGTWSKFSKADVHPALAINIFRDFLTSAGLSDWASSDLPRKILKGDVYIFTPEESNEESPRFCLRLYNGLIDEVLSSGCQWERDPKAWRTIHSFAEDLAGYERFRKVADDLRQLALIEGKIDNGESLDRSELSFVHEIYRNFRSIRPEGKLRLEKIVSGRDIRRDFSEIFECAPELVAISKDDIGRNTRVVATKLNSGDGKILNAISAPTVFLKDISLDGDVTLATIPANSEFLGRFSARNCSNLRGVGANTIFAKDAYFDGSIRLGDFDSGVEFRARAGFAGCVGLHRYPSSVSFFGAIDFGGSGVREIPDGVSFIGTVIFSKTSIKEIPPGTEFTLGAEFRECHKLIKIGSGVLFRGRANFAGCSNLESTGRGVRYLGPVSFEGSGLKFVSSGAQFFGEADFSNTANLQSVADGVVFGGPARFTGSGIQSVGEGVLFMGPVHLKSCKNLSSIGSSTVFNGPIYLRHCPLLEGFNSDQQH